MNVIVIDCASQQWYNDENKLGFVNVISALNDNHCQRNYMEKHT